MSDKLPEPRRTTTIATFTKEQTARYLSGGEIGRARFTDPEEQRKQDLQRQRLQDALVMCVQAFSSALHELSPQAEASLIAHHQGALEGRIDSMRMFVAMMGELSKQALMPDE